MSKAKRVKRKLKSKAAFTLAETLISVLILLMVSAVVAAGVPAAKSAYEGVVRASNAELLMSTTISTLRNELGMSNDVVVEDDSKTLSFINGSSGTGATIYIGEDTCADNTKVNTIMYQENALTSDLMLTDEEKKEYEDNVGSSNTSSRLVSEVASTGKLYTTYSSVAYDSTEGVITFNNLAVMESGETSPVTKRDVKIRVLSYDSM